MGIFSKIKNGISSKANAALDKAIDPEKELDMAIMELEEGRKKALAELVTYKATAKQLDADMEKQRAKATEWERRAMLAIKAGDDNAAREALRQKKQCEQEAAKIERDKHEAASYAIQLNKSRKEFETKLQILKLRKGTLATQIAAARSAGGDAFGNDTSVWDKFKAAEDRIDAEAIETEVDASLRGDDAEAMMLDAKLNAAAANAGLLGDGSAGDSLDALKAKMAAEKAAKQKALAAAQPAKPAEPKKLEAGKPDAAAAKPDAAKSDAAKPAASASAKADAAKSDAAKPAASAAADAAKPAASASADAAKPAASPSAKPDAAKPAASAAAKPDAAKPDAAKAAASAAAQSDAAKATAAAKPDAAKPAASAAATKPAASAPASKAAGNAGATTAPTKGEGDAKGEGEAKTDEPPRPQVKIDMAKLEAELAAMRAAAKNEK